MNALIAALEDKLRTESGELDRLEAGGAMGIRYEQAMRRWMELLAAYEYECDMVELAHDMAVAI